MTRKAIIDKTIQAINQLPDDKAEEISVFAEFLMKREEDRQLSEGIATLVSESSSFEFLSQEADLYTTDDLKEVYNGER